MEKYYLITDLGGYDGLSVAEFDNEAEALQQYAEDEAKTDRSRIKLGAYYEGVALIKGSIIKSKDLDLT